MARYNNHTEKTARETKMSSTPRDKNFTVGVLDYPARQLIGVKIRTNIQTCQADRPTFWHDTFAPLIRQLHAEGDFSSWGISCAYDAATGDFDYWAAIHPPKNRSIPKALQTFTLPSGLYAECALTSVTEIHTAYHFLYSRWLPAQSDYIGLENTPSFEHYPPDFFQTGRLSICIPIAQR